MDIQTPAPDKIRNICETVKKTWGSSTRATRRQSAIEKQRELAQLLNLHESDARDLECCLEGMSA